MSIHQTGASFYVHGLDKRIYMLRKNALFKMTKGQTNNKKQAPTSKQTTTCKQTKQQQQQQQQLYKCAYLRISFVIRDVPHNLSCCFAFAFFI